MKHFGKKIKRYHYLPILDDGNINDQGIDAAGVQAGADEPNSQWIATASAIPPGASGAPMENVGMYVPVYFVGESTGPTNQGTAEGICNAALKAFLEAKGFTGADVIAVVAAAELEGWVCTYAARDESAQAKPVSGNLYGSSKDVGYVLGKMPTLTEEGGRVNRVGHTRIELEGNIEKYGLFYDYTKESMDFDTDSELDMHCTRELLNAGNEIVEDLLQIDLLNAAGIIKFGGDATGDDEMNGETGTESLITYEDLMRLEIDLDQNRCPKQTKVITGTRMIDTRVVPGARIMYIGSELIPTVKRMTDLFGNQAFIGIEHYAAAGNTPYGNSSTLNGEIGAVGGFRIVVVPEMMHWAGVGAPVVANVGYRETNGQYDVYPMLVVGDASFTTIGFQTDGKTVKFKIKNVKPESDISYSHDDPFGEKGFSSLKFYYGFMVLRPERIALCKSVAEL